MRSPIVTPPASCHHILLTKTSQYKCYISYSEYLDNPTTTGRAAERKNVCIYLILSENACHCLSGHGYHNRSGVSGALLPACKVRSQDVPSFDYKPFLPKFWLCPVSLRAEEPLEECSECPVLAGQLAAGWRYRWSLTPGPN